MRYAATGDALITRRVTRWGGAGYDALLAVLRSADACFTNLETSLTNGLGAPAAGWSGTYLTSPAGCLHDLVAMGFNLFARANNHAGDWGPEGVMETTRVCDAAGVCHAGAGRDLAEARLPAYADVPAGKIALLAVTTATQGAGYRAGLRRDDSPGRPGANCLRYEEYAVVPSRVMVQLRALVARTKVEQVRRYEVALGFRAPDPDGVLSIGAVKFREGRRAGDAWEVNQRDVDEILRQVREARRQADTVLLSFHAHDMAGGDPDAVPTFHREFCRRCIEAGCDAVIGHGPHRLRGIEVYRGRPIFYSLGNFIFQNEEAQGLPADFYERLGLDPLLATPADGFDRRNSRGKGGFAADPAYWETVVAWWEIARGQLREIRLYPVELGFGRPRPRRGRPVLARGRLARAIVARMDRLCRPLGTRVTWSRAGYGLVRW
ncbi:MAG: CapA family protein [Armatimonadota bacterium]|nr:CapA family protein [Armatimonadota bacterium]MDR7534328.1 CapA family protein [Armatimonadota bacterium]MDR7537498.1 CapA family protein [Armatimonadota bacterium]